MVSRVILLFPLVAHFSFADIMSPEFMAERRALQSENVTKVKKFPCAEHSGPLQTLREGKDAYSLNERTLTGNSTVYTIPRNRTSPSWEQINACGINPIDDILYCIINVSSTSYLVRIDDSIVEFVAKTPSWSWTATFSSVGTYYFAHDSKYYRVEKAAELVGYADQNDAGLEDLSNLTSFASLGAGADMVVVSADVEGTGEEAEYIMTLANAGKLRVTRATGEVKSWLLQSKPELDTNDRSYGAAWNYQNRVFFSQNKAGGMYEPLINTIDLVAGTVVIDKVGPSFDNGGTDGANCINMKIPSKYSGKCGEDVGAYSALTKGDPFPAPGATDVRPSQELIFLPDHDATVTGYQVFLGPATLNDDGSVASVEWHVACNLPCGVNVCKPPHGLDNTLGGNFAWRVDHVKADGSTVQGEVWQFSLVKTVTYDTRAIADTYIDKKDKPYGDKRHMLMRAKTTNNPQFGFVKFDITPPAYVGVLEDDCDVEVLKAEIRLTVLSKPMKNVKVYLIKPEKADFNQSNATSATGKHPGSGVYPDVFDGDTLIEDVMGPVPVKKSFTISVTENVSNVFNAGGDIIAFGLETEETVSRFCAQSHSTPRGEGWCYPKLEVLLGIGKCPGKAAQEPSCSKPADSPPGPLDAMCNADLTPTFPGEPTDWRENTEITTTTTTTTTTKFLPIKEGQCRYNDHVYCPWPNDNTMCSGDQCCPDGSTCPSSQFHQAQGCNLKKYDCTPELSANLTCREAEEVFCPGTDIKCSGDTCCPNNSTCPSASVQQVEECGPKSVDCQAPLSAEFSCAIGEFVFCPATDSDLAFLSSKPAKECSAHPKCVAAGLEGDCCATAEGVFLDCCEGTYTYRNDKCHGNQCCPDGSTCPSAPSPQADGCGPKKATCELLAWTVKLRVSSIIFANVDEDTVDVTKELVKEFIAARVGTDNVEVNASAAEDVPSARRLALKKEGMKEEGMKEEGMILTAKVGAPGGWSQKKFDSAMESSMLSEETTGEMEEMLSEIDGLQEASSGDMVFQKVEAEKDDPPETTSTQAPIDSSSDSSKQAPTTSLRGSDTSLEASTEVTSSASTFCFLPAHVMIVLVLMKPR